MTHDLSTISTYACWTRLNETPEQIAHMTMTFMKEFSSRIVVGRWKSLKNDWDGGEEGLVELIEKSPVRDDDGNPVPGDGYHFLLPVEGGPLSTDLRVEAGRDTLPVRFASPCFSQKYYWSAQATAGEVWDASVHAAVMAFDPAFVTGQERTILRMTRRGEWKISFGYRVWINDWVGAIATHADGLALERIGNGTLIRVPDDWPAQHVVDALTETFTANNLDEVPTVR
jgi:hypothetical protein